MMGSTFKNRSNTFFFTIVGFGLLQIQDASSKSSNNGYHPDFEALYYGFFFNESVATSIQNLTQTYFSALVDGIPEFHEFMNSAVKNSSTGGTIQDYFKKPVDPNTLQWDPEYHVTTKYCGDANCSEYRNKVKPHKYQKFQMNLVGYVLTNRTFGVRVNLTEEQDALFDNYARTTSSSSPSSRGKRSTDHHHKKTKRSKTRTLPFLQFVEQPLNLNPTKERPHITLGAAPNVSAVTTGPDVLGVIDFERENGTTVPRNISVLTFSTGVLRGTNATIIHYKGGPDFGDAFVIYPSIRVVTTATFKPYLKPRISGGNKIQKSALYVVVCVVLVFLYHHALALPSISLSSVP